LLALLVKTLAKLSYDIWDCAEFIEDLDSYRLDDVSNFDENDLV